MSEAMADVLRRYPDLDGVFCTNEDVADMYLGLDKGENTPVMVGVDATSVQQKAITDGQELGTVSQDPYDIGYQTIIAAAQAMSTDSAQAASVEKNVLLEPDDVICYVREKLILISDRDSSHWTVPVL